MRPRIIAAGCLLLLSFASGAQEADPVAAPMDQPSAAPAQGTATTSAAPAASVADRLLEEIDLSLQLAREGGYGRLKRGDTARLEKARERIDQLLAGHADPAELPAEARLEVHNAQQLIAGILKRDDKDRVVCKREPILGSRVAGTECLTVGQREARTRQSRENTDFVQRTVCVPGEEGVSRCE